jgi:hypothetical protein
MEFAMSIIGINYPTLTVSIGLLLLLAGQIVPPRKRHDRPLSESGASFILSGVMGFFASASWCFIPGTILTLLFGIMYLWIYFSPDEDWPSNGGDVLHTDGRY